MYPIFGVVFLYTCFIYSTAVAALNTRASQTGFSTFIYPTGDGNLTFALSATKSGDLYMHLSAPATYQWIGVGTGSQMAGSVMLIIYKNSNENSITLSPRLGTGHVEPSHNPSIDCAIDNSSSITRAANNKPYFSASIICKNISSLGETDGKLNLTSTKQPFLYAWGPTSPSLSSSSKTAGIARHAAYGNFWMDMSRASVSDASAPSGNALQSTMNAGADGQATSDGDNLGPAHAALMLLAFTIIFPLGAVLLRWLGGVRGHWITQSIGLIITIAGVAVGIDLGTMYNKSKDMSSAHQVLGLTLLGLLLVQYVLGATHHLRYRKFGTPTVFGKIHRVVGPVVVLAGIVNGFVGLDFSGEEEYNKWYGIVVAVVLAGVLGALGWRWWVGRREKKGDGGAFRMESMEGRA